MKRQNSDSTESGLKPARSEKGGRNAGSQFLFDFGATSAPAPVVIPPGRERPEWRFALRFAAIMEAEPASTFDNAEVSRLAREIFGASAGRARDAYDAAEAGFNIYIERSGLDLSDARAAIAWLIAEQARLPRQTRRDEVQVELQQFSTPPAQAFVLIQAAALLPGMKVLEPSAGTGNIAVLARLADAEIDTNEIDERRLSLLSLQGFEPTAFDAERLDNLLPADKLYDAIVMNPPFSAPTSGTGPRGARAGASHGVRSAARRASAAAPQAHKWDVSPVDDWLPSWDAGWRWSGLHFANGGPKSSSATAFGRTWASTDPRTLNSERRSTTRSSSLTETARPPTSRTSSGAAGCLFTTHTI